MNSKSLTMTTSLIAVIRIVCNERNISNAVLSERSGISISGITKLFKGNTNPSISTIHSIVSTIPSVTSQVMLTAENLVITLTSNGWTLVEDGKEDTLLSHLDSYFKNDVSKVHKPNSIMGFNMNTCPVIEWLTKK